MFNLVGNARVMNLKKVSPKMTICDVYTSYKEGEEWKSTFLKAKIVGEAKNQLAIDKCGEKDLIEIQSSALREETRVYNDKEYKDLVLTIFKAEKVKSKEDLTPIHDKDMPF